MSSSSILNFDTTYSTYINDRNNTASSLSSFVASFPLQNPIRKIKRISLLSLEMPVQFNNVRTSISFSYTTTLSTTGSFTISVNQTFTTITSLLTYINSQIPTIANVTIVFSVSPTIPNQVIATTTGLTTFNLINYTDKKQFLKNILGFNGSESLVSGVLTASSYYNLNLDNFICLYLSNVPHETTNQNQSNCSFKVPLNAVSNTIYYFSQNNSYTSWINVSDNNFVLDKLNVSIYDRYSNNLNPNGGDWSFTLRIDSD